MFILLFCTIFLLDLSQAGIGTFDGPDRYCSFSDTIKNITYNTDLTPHVIGGIDFVVDNAQRGLRFCITVPEGYEMAMTMGDDFNSYDFDKNNLLPRRVDALIFTANGAKSKITDGNLYLDKEKRIKYE